MGRRLDLGLAMKYPFRAENRTQTIWIPGIIMVVAMIMSFILSFILLFALGKPTLSDPYDPARLIPQTFLQMLITYPAMALFMGFYWELAEILRRDGYAAPAPPWSGNWGRYWTQGWKLFLFGFLLGLPMLIANLYFIMTRNLAPQFMMMFAVMPLAPFFFGSYIQALPEKRFVDLFRIGHIWQTGTCCYWQVMLATLIYLILFFISIPLMFFLSCTIVGYPLLLTYLVALNMHLVIQAFDAYRPDDPSPSAGDNPPRLIRD